MIHIDVREYDLPPKIAELSHFEQNAPPASGFGAQGSKLLMRPATSNIGVSVS